MRILAIGDITSPGGVEHLRKNLWTFRRSHAIDLCLVNGENGSLIHGISPDAAKLLNQSGADVITGGNHTLHGRAVLPFLEEAEYMLRPINYPEPVAGRGYTFADACGYRVLVINAMGTAMIEPPLDSPYPYIDRVLAREAGRYDLAILDFHAEATGEKVAMGYAYDGKIAVVFGTHTHVQTADEIILPGGTGYITDLGMCGESGGVLGMESAGVIERMRTHLPTRFAVASGPCVATGAIFTWDAAQNKVTAIERVRF